jgi:hypothetical protein
MPSHVALVDPLLLYIFLRQRVALYPVMTSRFYDNVLLKPLFKLITAIRVQILDSDQGNPEDMKVLMNQLSVALTDKKSLLLYPQGGLAKQGYQSIIGKKSAFYAVQHAPKETKFITVSIR